MDLAFQYYIDADGACTEKDYPYTGVKGRCRKCNPTVNITGYYDVERESGGYGYHD